MATTAVFVIGAVLAAVVFIIAAVTATIGAIIAAIAVTHQITAAVGLAPLISSSIVCSHFNTCDSTCSSNNMDILCHL